MLAYFVCMIHRPFTVLTCILHSENQRLYVFAGGDIQPWPQLGSLKCTQPPMLCIEVVVMASSPSQYPLSITYRCNLCQQQFTFLVDAQMCAVKIPSQNFQVRPPAA